MAFNLPPMNTQPTLETILQYLAAELPFLFPAILFLIFLGITMSGYFYQERRNGRANLPQWLSIGSFITTISAMVLFFIPNVIDLYTIGTGIALSILFTIWFLFSDKD